MHATSKTGSVCADRTAVYYRDYSFQEGTFMEYCEHVSSIRDVTPSADGCEDCLKIGATWVHLRLCEECGHVGCCDSSPNRHATKHFHATKHPIVRSFEPGEEWGYCYVDDAFYETLPGVKGASRS